MQETQSILKREFLSSDELYRWLQWVPLKKGWQTEASCFKKGWETEASCFCPVQDWILFCRSFVLLLESCEDHTHSNFENYYYQMNKIMSFAFFMTPSIVPNFFNWPPFWNGLPLLGTKWLLEKKLILCPACCLGLHALIQTWVQVQ